MQRDYMRLDMHHKFFLATYLWSWPLWGILAVTSTPLEGIVPLVIFAIAGIGPSLMGILFARRTQSAAYWESFKNRATSFSLISPRGYAAIVLFVPVTSLVAIAAYGLIYGALPSFEAASSYVSNPVTLITFAAFTMVFGPIPEELGWRGFAQDSLERTRDWVTASAAIGVGWTLWHIPLLFIPGTYQNDLVGSTPWPVIDFFVQFIILAVITGWIRWSQKGSILSAILFHFFTNYVGEILDLPIQGMYIRTAVQLCFALVIVWHYRSRPLAPEGRPTI